MTESIANLGDPESAAVKDDLDPPGTRGSLVRWLAASLAALVCLLPWLEATAASSLPPKQVALVIGNSNYRDVPLGNPVNDAADMAKKLRSLGFTVIERQDLTSKQVGSALREFRSKLTPGSIALFFYAGHGLQVKGNNYLPVVDAEIASEEDVPMQSINVTHVLEMLEEAKTQLNLVFLDACRNNPFTRRFRSAAGGLAKVSAPSGTLISFATRPGSVASDGSGRNGLYTHHLLEHMAQINTPIELMLKKVVSGVKAESKGAQEPWMEGAIEGDFCFSGCDTGATPSAQAATTHDNSAVELKFWDSIKASQSAADYRAYIAQYPNGSFVALAKARANALSGTPQSAASDKRVSTTPFTTASAAIPVPAEVVQTAADGAARTFNCSDLVTRLSMGIDPLSEQQRRFLRENCR